MLIATKPEMPVDCTASTLCMHLQRQHANTNQVEKSAVQAEFMLTPAKKPEPDLQQVTVTVIHAVILVSLQFQSLLFLLIKRTQFACLPVWAGFPISCRVYVHTYTL